jgi:hypothetical protein
MSNNWIEIGSELTDNAFEQLNVGHILRFRDGDGFNELKVMKINKKSRKCFVRPVKTFTPEELDGTVTVIDEN